MSLQQESKYVGVTYPVTSVVVVPVVFAVPSVLVSPTGLEQSIISFRKTNNVRKAKAEKREKKKKTDC